MFKDPPPYLTIIWIGAGGAKLVVVVVVVVAMGRIEKPQRVAVI